MNALDTASTHTTTHAPADDTVVPLSSARRYIERSAGTGYGRSSGYASHKRYTSDWGQPRFRCA